MPPSVSGGSGGSPAEAAAAVRERIGVAPLSDGDLLLLAYEEISRTTTYEEKSYGSDPPPCAT